MHNNECVCDFEKTEYVGPDIARGINVRKWQSCVYFDIIETTVK